MFIFIKTYNQTHELPTVLRHLHSPMIYERIRFFHQSQQLPIDKPNKPLKM